MAKFVIKKDGDEEPLDIEKLKQSIRINAIESVLEEAENGINNLAEQISCKVVQSVSNREKLTTDELREIVLKELDTVAPKVATTWREFVAQKENA